ncbi:MAG: GNAT family N-acetyltransferase [Gemmatimonadaceae bacterium]
MILETDHLRLVPHLPGHLLVLIDDPARFEETSGFAAASGLRDFFVSDDVSSGFLSSLRSLRDADPWRLGFAVVHSETRSVIGSGGYKGPPNAEGTVEIAYGIVPGFQGRGYATEVARALVAYAVTTGKVRVVLAHTLPNPNASTKVLAKCGFELKGEVNDPDDGLVWRWELLPSIIDP